MNESKMDLISIKMKAGGKSSVISFNKRESYDGLGSVLNTFVKHHRLPFNSVIKERLKVLRFHMLCVYGFVDDEMGENYSFDTGCVLAPVLENLNVEMLKDFLSRLRLDYVYKHDGKIRLGGSLTVLGNSDSIALETCPIHCESDYAYFDELEAEVEGLFGMVTKYLEKPEMDSMQLSLALLEITKGLDGEDAINYEMTNEERIDMINKEMKKSGFELDLEDMGFVGAPESVEGVMMGVDEEEEPFENIKMESKDVEGDEEFPVITGPGIMVQIKASEKDGDTNDFDMLDTKKAKKKVVKKTVEKPLGISKKESAKPKRKLTEDKNEIDRIADEQMPDDPFGVGDDDVIIEQMPRL